MRRTQTRSPTNSLGRNNQGSCLRAECTTTRSKTNQKVSDLVHWDFNTPSRDRLLVAVITYMLTHAGFLYLSVVIDAFNRRVVGWSMANYLRSELLDRGRFATKTAARIALFEYIEGFYNTRSRHSSLGYLSPENYERTS